MYRVVDSFFKMDKINVLTKTMNAIYIIKTSIKPNFTNPGIRLLKEKVLGTLYAPFESSYLGNVTKVHDV